MSSDNSNTTNTSISQPSCPVDHKARAAWLDQAKLHGADNDNNPTANISRDTFSSASKTQSCDSSTIDQTLSPNTSTPTPTSSNPAPNPAQPSSPLKSAFDYLPIPFLQRKNRHPPVSTPETLDTERQVSSIPRATITSSPSPSLSPLTRSSQNTSNGGETTNYTSSSSNNTNPTNISGHLNRESPTEGNWIYPSERMFFDAMRRKSHDPRAEDMRAIVPIHNAVNERAWSEIRAWERGRGAERYGFSFHHIYIYIYSSLYLYKYMYTYTNIHTNLSSFFLWILQMRWSPPPLLPRRCLCPHAARPPQHVAWLPAAL